MLIVFAFLMFSLLLPLADVAIAGFQYISAWQALRAFGQAIQYSPPDNVTNPSSSWTTKVIAAGTGLGLTSENFSSNFKVLCDGVACTSANSTAIKSYWYQTSIILSPMTPGLKSVLCTSGVGNGCTFTLSYSERFQ
jgi:hypothetical protein